jgi:DNA-binding GntR family transcriptional regulator
MSHAATTRKRGLLRGLRGQIADRIREDIISCRLAEGERLSEMSLAARFGVSRGPIREALVQLTHEGLLVAKPNCGVRVAPATTESIRELILPIRRTIEIYALRAIFDDLNESDFAVCEGILQDMALACQRKDVAAAVEQDIAFHRSLLERADQPDLLAIWSTIVARVRRHFWQVHRGHQNTPIDVHADHQLLVDVFRSGDKEAAARALEAHIT